MRLITMKEALSSLDGSRALGAFNALSMETMQAIVRAAAGCERPAIVAIGPAAFVNHSYDDIVDMARAVSSRWGVPLVLHLDHGRSFDHVVKAIRAGFTSVMFDGSNLPWSENIERTRQVVEVAHAAGVDVEGEVGMVPGTEDDISTETLRLASPDEVDAFVRATGVDTVAPAIGSRHGIYQGSPLLRFDLLEAIHRQVDLPLVLHGGTGLSPYDFRRAIELGIRKVNIGTGIKEAYRQGFLAAATEEPLLELPQILGRAMDRVRRLVAAYMALFNGAPCNEEDIKL